MKIYQSKPFQFLVTQFYSDHPGFNRQGHCVIISEIGDHKPLASGVSYLSPTDTDNPEHGESIAARRACRALAFEVWSSEIQTIREWIDPSYFERDLYHKFRLARWEATIADKVLNHLSPDQLRAAYEKAQANHG